MANLVAVDNKNHINTKVNLKKVEQYGANLHLIPVVLSEFIHLAVQYPIVITKNGNTGQFVFSTMLGFEKNENLFWKNEQWQGLYVPLQIRRQPFFVEAKGGNKNNELAVCLNTNSPALLDNIGEGLFDEKGNESKYFQEVKASLAQLLMGEKENKILLDQLTSMALIQSMSLEISFVNKGTLQLTGLYTIDQEKLASLNNEQVCSLHKTGLLPAIYTMITSLGQIQALINLKNKRLTK
ncbi:MULTISPECIES: SapC family protein [unclassified Colwellia]|uniref:SapC family protein n=1 Tax=unclassified Colwellia TaxID=196834 RepID=UPI0015F64A36|nr:MULTISPECIES: SapC family protein [unclassified Colwellia]MBA6234051.1 SapC family protein [Colwellia sp. MB02u-7]MBA6238027.1 SapC family protein [Colwellia sp. MB02u-11]MBA6257646.1 SapC family protein [Colwellia sp. MB3u-28]MBA6259403.1 SapC family protein [Colwellia sp. MB3u-41]MBA6300725.1 SapC family protein [Colwellia sp. MB3u-22]